MLDIETLSWRDQFILTREITVAGDRSEFYRRVRGGEFVPIRRGVYATTENWNQQTEDARYRLRVLVGVAASDRNPVVSHHSAVALWRLPWVGGWPISVHFLDGITTGGRSRGRTVRHSGGVPLGLTVIEGVAVTSLAQTVVDIAATASFGQAVVVADAALRRTEHPVDGVPQTSLRVDDLVGEVARRSLRHGTAKAKRAILFADGLADRPGESLSRVNIFLAGFSAPVLQQELTGISGRVWHVDFWWPAFGLIGEFDGASKYSDPEFLRGRSPAQALRDEKAREDDLRAAGHRFSRWGRDTARSVTALRAHLIAAGLR